MPKSLDFGFNYGASSTSRPRNDDGPFHIVVLADLSGATARKGLRVRRVDIDNLEQLFATVSPSVSVDLGPGLSLAIEFENEDCFHPDELYERLPLFQRFREIKGELGSPATFAAAAAALSLPLDESGEESSPTGAGTGAAEAASTELEALLGGRGSGNSGGRASSVVDDLVRAVVGPHLVQSEPPDVAKYQRLVDESVADQMRSLLQAPTFRALEAAWVGLRGLVMACAEEDLRISVIDLSREELEAELRAESLESGELSGALSRLAPDELPALLVADFEFGRTREQLVDLAALGAVARSAGAAVLASASGCLVGCPDGAVGNDGYLSDWPEVEAELASAWADLRRQAVAGSIALCYPRVLLRLPYGAKTEEVEAFEFEEIRDAQPRHGDYLWGGAAMRLAQSFGSAYVQRGRQMSLASLGPIEDLPVHAYKDAEGSSRMQACAEAFISEAAAHRLIDLGLVPVVSLQNRNQAALPRIQSLREGGKALEGVWQD
jgi:type VI secretion system protein ImpC